MQLVVLCFYIFEHFTKTFSKPILTSGATIKPSTHMYFLKNI